MTRYLRRSINEPIREGLSVYALWNGDDHGPIWCWERGRQKRAEQPELAAQAENGELPLLAWKGGVAKKLEVGTKSGTLKYLATWQGLRGQDLEIALDYEQLIVCRKTGQTVAFSAVLPPDEE